MNFYTIFLNLFLSKVCMLCTVQWLWCYAPLNALVKGAIVVLIRELLPDQFAFQVSICSFGLKLLPELLHSNGINLIWLFGLLVEARLLSACKNLGDLSLWDCAENWDCPCWKQPSELAAVTPLYMKQNGKWESSYVTKPGTTLWCSYSHIAMNTVYCQIKQKTHTYIRPDKCAGVAMRLPENTRKYPAHQRGRKGRKVLWAALTAHNVLHRPRLWCWDYFYSLTTCVCPPQIHITQHHIGSQSIF